jgi:hypothetical protein|tara:strand:+ start:73 stop:255 length:183 start_codon:yes stop_codon:yes gene_type:complete
MTKKTEDNIVPVEDFWQRKVNKINTLYAYGAIGTEEYIEEMVRLGFTQKQILDDMQNKED